MGAKELFEFVLRNTSNEEMELRTSLLMDVHDLLLEGYRCAVLDLFPKEGNKVHMEDPLKLREGP